MCIGWLAYIFKAQHDRVYHGDYNTVVYEPEEPEPFNIYREVSNIRRTESQHLNDSRFSLQLSLRDILKPGVKPRMM